MAKSVLELAVETGKWDAGLRKSTSSLNSFIEHAGGLRQVLDKDSEKMKKFVQMMGTFESTAKTAKGQMNDYKSTIEQLTMQYNRMTDAQKESIGPTYLQSIDQLKKKYQSVNDEIREMNRSLGQIEVPDLGKEGKGLFHSGMLDGMFQVFGGNMMTKAAGFAMDFANEIGNCVKQGIELAKQGEGIRIAFERLGRGDILDGLREATHGTVTDIELMKASVKFNDFKLPLEELGTMLAFAQQKAKDTGQSVDYMVDSIVTGLGRKSLMILDNLGLSASEIREKMKETGDMTKAVGEIIRSQMASAGEYVETAADRAAQANVSLQNKMEELGRKFGPVEEASNQLWTSMKIGILDVIGGPLARLLNGLTEAGRLKNALNDMNGEDGSGNTKVGQQLKKLQVIKKAGGSDYIFNSTLSGMMEDYNRQIMELDRKIKDTKKLSPDQQASKFVRDEVQKMSEQMKALGTMRDQLAAGAREIIKPVEVNVNTDKAEQNVASLKKKLKELEAERKKAVKAGDQELVDTFTKQINETKTNLGYLDPSSVKTTGGKSKQQQAEEKVSAALMDYQQTIDVANMEMQSGVKTEADTKKTMLSAQERLYDAYGIAYAMYADPKYKEAQDKAAAEIVRLGGEVKNATEAQKKAEQAARELEAAQKKLAEAAAKAVNAELNNDLKGFYQANKAIVANGGRPMQTPIDITYTDSNLQAFIDNLKERLSKSDVGSDLYNALTKQLADANMLGNFISLAVKNGIDVAQIDPQALFSKIFGDGQTAGDFIPDDFWKGFVEQFKNALGEELSINTGTGEVKEGKSEDEFKKFNEGLGKLSGGLSQLTSGLRAVGIDIPKEVDQVIGVINGVSQIISGASAIISLFGTTAMTANTTAVSLNTGAIASLIVALKMHTCSKFLFAGGGVIPHAATGYYVPGNNYSGDTTPVLANAGELVLNKAQQGNLAAQLEGGGIGNLQLETRVGAEDLIFVLNNNASRRGFGEFIDD